MKNSVSMKHHKVLCSKEYRERMEKSVTIMGKHLNREFWFVFLGSFFLLYAIFVLSGQYSGFTMVTNCNITSVIFTDDPLAIGETEETLVSDSKDKTEPVSKQTGLDLCMGKYIYVHDLPSRFNEDIIRNCSSLVEWFDMCRLISNMGLGPLAKNSKGVLQNQSWHETNQFVLEIIFHNRMKKYKCLTNDSSMASAIYVPFYAGLDVGRYLFGNGLNTSVRDALPLDLVKWLRGKPEWNYMMGKDHFFVCGRITWDFRRQSDNVRDWGNKLLTLPEAKNMTVLGIESSPWTDQEFSIPYPTYFHPLSDDQVIEWQNKVRRRRRPYLFSFVGAPRPNLEGSIRGMIINQCLASGRKCKLVDCSSSYAARNCHEPVHVMKMFQRSVFCLQPPGDSYTRRSTFDSILAGCIPVFFHPESAYHQYKWHLPANHTKYSVFIPEDMVKEGKAKIGKILDGIPRLQVSAMREEVVKLIPRVVYADPNARLENLEDAFDIAVSKVLERVEYIRRDMIKMKNEEI